MHYVGTDVVIGFRESGKPLGWKWNSFIHKQPVAGDVIDQVDVELIDGIGFFLEPIQNMLCDKAVDFMRYNGL